MMALDTLMAEPLGEGLLLSMSELLAVIRDIRAENAALKVQVQGLPIANALFTSNTPGGTATHGERRLRAPKSSSFNGQRTNYKP